MYFTLIFFLMLIMPVIVMPKYMIAGPFSPHRIVIQATIVIAICIMVMFMVASNTGEGLYAQAQAAVDMLSQQAASIPQLTDMLGIADLSKEEQIDAIARVYDRASIQIPISLLFMGAVIAYLEYLIISKLIAKKAEVKKMPKFRELTFPQGTAMAVMLMYLAAWIIYNDGSAFGEMLYLNIDQLFDIVFSLQGVSVVLMLFYLKRLPNVAGVVAAVIMWATSIGRMLLVMIGIADLMLGLKARMRGSSVRKS